MQAGYLYFLAQAKQPEIKNPHGSNEHAKAKKVE